ncbi:MAG: metallophosphoesterase [Hyphomicrobiaceae bacterium]
MPTRRTVLKGLAGMAGGLFSLSGYALAYEPIYRCVVTRYAMQPARWPAGLHLRAVVVADVHAGNPSMSLSRVEGLVDLANGLGGDVILLLGDYSVSHPFHTGKIPLSDIAKALAALKAPLGAHAVLGNHDWWEDHDAQRLGRGPIRTRHALEAASIPVYENDVVRLAKGDRQVWLAGLGDQWAFRGPISPDLGGVDDLPATLAKITDDAPVILLAHEPDIFPSVPDRVALTISGHTHGGQVNLFGWTPIVPSKYGSRYVYGHIIEDRRNLIVSGGLGCSVIPVRFGRPPEVVVIDIGPTGLA